MSTATSPNNVVPARARAGLPALLTALEIALVYAGILLYIWRWQFTSPRIWIVLLAIIVASQVARREHPASLGLTLRGMRTSAQLMMPLALALFVPLVVYGLASGAFLILPPGGRILISFVVYAFWCVFQQYLVQSYFHVRLMSLIENRHLSSAVVALMFGGAHIPNPILMIATTLGGFLLAEVFARHRNIWPLALAQTVAGFLIAALSPDWLIHNMRVGPGYFFFGL